MNLLRNIIESYRLYRGQCVICGLPRSDVYCSIACILKDPDTTLSERRLLTALEGCKQESN